MFKIHLDQFEGPLDLLLYFIRRDEIDIYDIPISKITQEYLDVIDEMSAMNISVAGEFVLMAATLMRIKSKMLIPRPEIDDEGEPIDPRTELVQKLLEYQQFKDISTELIDLREKIGFLHQRKFFEEISSSNIDDIPISDISLFELAELFKNAMEKAPLITSLEMRSEPVSLSDRKKNILSSFDGDGKLSFNRLISNCKDKLDIIITFLALLDLIRLRQIAIFQNELFDEIELHILNNN